MGLKIERKDSQLTGEVTLEFEICGNSSFVLNVACYPKAWGSLMPVSQLHRGNSFYSNNNTHHLMKDYYSPDQILSELNQ